MANSSSETETTVMGVVPAKQPDETALPRNQYDDDPVLARKYHNELNRRTVFR